MLISEFHVKSRTKINCTTKVSFAFPSKMLCLLNRFFISRKQKNVSEFKPSRSQTTTFALLVLHIASSSTSSHLILAASSQDFLFNYLLAIRLKLSMKLSKNEETKRLKTWDLFISDFQRLWLLSCNLWNEIVLSSSGINFLWITIPTEEIYLRLHLRVFA